MNASTIRARSLAVSLAAALAAAGCGKSITSTEALPPATPGGTDANAGTWKMLVLSGPTQIAVAAPSPVTASDYLAELQQVKDAQRGLTPEQRATIDYWSGGGVLRWNQILRELVAR